MVILLYSIDKTPLRIKREKDTQIKLRHVQWEYLHDLQSPINKWGHPFDLDNQNIYDEKGNIVVRAKQRDYDNSFFAKLNAAIKAQPDIPKKTVVSEYLAYHFSKTAIPKAYLERITIFDRLLVSPPKEIQELIISWCSLHNLDFDEAKQSYLEAIKNLQDNRAKFNYTNSRIEHTKKTLAHLENDPQLLGEKGNAKYYQEGLLLLDFLNENLINFSPLNFFLKSTPEEIFLKNFKDSKKSEPDLKEEVFINRELFMCEQGINKNRSPKFQYDTSLLNKFLDYKDYLLKRKENIQQFATVEGINSGLELTEKLLIISFLQIQELFPNYDPKGLFSKTAMFQLMSALFSEKEDTVKKSWQRATQILENTGTTSHNRKQRLAYLNNIKVILSQLHNAKLDSEIARVIKAIGGKG